jgi:MFS family permease
MGLTFTLVCLLIKDWETFNALQALQSFTQATGSSTGLVIIHDLFDFHEHAREISIGYKFFLVSPLAVPMFENSMIVGLGEWRPVFWLLSALKAVFFVMARISIDETSFSRSVPKEK